MNKSQTFQLYNKAKAAARNGKLDEMRVNRALSVLQSADGEDTMKKYRTTINTCNCQDRKHHPHQACKHMIAAMVIFRANQAEKKAAVSNPAPVADNPNVYTASNGDTIMAEQTTGGYVLHTFESAGQYADWRNKNLMVRMVKPSEVKGKKLYEVTHKEF
jgi:hypothetical protein